MRQLEGRATTSHHGVEIVLPGVDTSTYKRRQNFRVAEDIEDKVRHILEWEGLKAREARKGVPWYAVNPFTVIVRKGPARSIYLILVVEVQPDRGGSGNIVD